MATNPLTDLIPAQYRKLVYVVAAAALFVYGLYVVADGDIKAFVIALVSALVAGLAASNTSEPELDPGNDLDGHQV